jgi:anti-sigma factor RsiW
MTDCPNGTVRDLLPEYAHGALERDEAARVAAHLADCAICREELALLEQIRDGLTRGAPQIDVAAIVRALPSSVLAVGETPRLRVLTPRRWVNRHVWQYAAAAGLILAAGSGIVWKFAPEGQPARLADSSQVAATPAVDATPTSGSMGADDGITFGGGLSDLSVDDLQLLLGQMDSLRTLPSTDPQSVTPVIAINDGGKTL